MASHTATGEWQSFEVRMRRRRAERLLLRAQLAAQEGRVEEARECLEEARTLMPRAPEVIRVEVPRPPPEPLEPVRAVAIEPAPDPIVVPVTIAMPEATLATEVEPPAPRGRRRGLAIAAAVAAMATLAAVPIAWRVERGPSAAAVTQGAAVAPVAPVNVEPAAAIPAGYVAPQPMPFSAPVRPTGEQPLESVPPAAPPAPIAIGSKPLAAAADSVRLPEVAATRSADPPAAEPTTGRIEPVTPPPVPVSSVDAAAVALPAPTIELPAAEVPQEPRIQAVLNRYASAYNDLDAGAAQQVWPGVNREALARAFDGLVAQRVTLESCRIDVAGRTAQARCDGSATWEPRVGAGTRTEARSWSFSLERGAADKWQIVSARVQNR